MTPIYDGSDVSQKIGDVLRKAGKEEDFLVKRFYDIPVMMNLDDLLCSAVCLADPCIEASINSVVTASCHDLSHRMPRIDITGHTERFNENFGVGSSKGLARHGMEYDFVLLFRQPFSGGTFKEVGQPWF